MAKQQTTKSIYDFIYLDLDRIHSYYAQLTDGLPNQKTLSNREQKVRGGKVTAFPRDVVHFEGCGDDTKEETLEQLMDMHHVLPRDMINLLDEHCLISKKLAASNLGKLVMVEGLIHFSDFETLSNSSEPVFNIVGNMDEFKEHGGDSSIDFKTFFKVMDVLNAGVQASLQVKSQILNYAWMSLDSKYLTSAHLVSALKHTTFSSEKFYVLGILDAIPEKFENDTSHQNEQEKFNEALLAANPLNSAIFSMNQMSQELAGRPKDFFGITPISIFRVLEAKIES